MKKILILVALLCCAVPAHASMFASAVGDVPLLSLERLSGAVGFDYVVQVDTPDDREWVPKLGVILAYKLTRSISIGGQGWILADDIKAPKEIRAVVRWRVF